MSFGLIIKDQVHIKVKYSNIKDDTVMDWFRLMSLEFGCIDNPPPLPYIV